MTTEECFGLFSRFPVDIQRLIFEEAFEESHRKAIHIALVSRDVRSWIEPLIYQCITLNRHTYSVSERRRFHQFASTFRKSPNSHTRYVRKLFIDDLQKEKLAENLLPLCSNLVSLACWARPKADNQTILHILLSPDTHSLPHLRRLSIYWGCLPIDYQSFRHPIFRNLTHLDVDFDPMIRWDVLSSLQNLHYFNLDCISACFGVQDVQQLEGVLKATVEFIAPYLPVVLRCFIALVPSTVIGHLLADDLDDAFRDARQFCTDIISGKFDVRLVLGLSPGISQSLGFQNTKEQRDLVNHMVAVPYNLDAWTYLPQGRTDFWMEAEEIIEKRRRELKNQSSRRRSA